MLTDATHANAVDWYTYQPNSDRLDHVSGGIVGSRAYTYDANGTVRRIDANGQSVWLSTDYNGMPIRMDFNTGAGAGSVYSTMAYSGLNQRSFYHDAGGINHYNSYDGAEPGAALLSDSINVYTPGISQHSAAGSRFYVSDAQGSLRGTHDPNTSLTNDLRFDAFGQQDFHGGSAPSALPLAWHQSSNYQTDNDSGLMLLGNRYYDSVVGRFLSPDPAGDGDNWYAYCGNNPLGGTDPTGLMATGMTAPTGANFGNPIGQANSAIDTINELGSWGVAVQKGRDQRKAEKAARLLAQRSASQATNVSYATFRFWTPGRVKNNLDYSWPVEFDARDGKKYILLMPGHTTSSPLTDIDFVYLGGLNWVHLLPFLTTTINQDQGDVVITYANPQGLIRTPFWHGMEPWQQPGVFLPVMPPATAFKLGYIQKNTIWNSL